GDVPRAERPLSAVLSDDLEAAVQQTGDLGGGGANRCRAGRAFAGRLALVPALVDPEAEGLLHRSAVAQQLLLLFPGIFNLAEAYFRGEEGIVRCLEDGIDGGHQRRTRAAVRAQGP